MFGEYNNDTQHTSSFEKLKRLDALFDEQLRGEKAENKFNVPVKKNLAKLGGFCLLLVLPFFVLIRISLYLYTAYGFNGWIALTGGAAATILLLLIYMVIIARRMTQKRIINKYMLQGTSVFVLAYCCYALLYFSGMNAKNPEVRSYYHTLHPILRITLTTATLADQQLIITDMKRVPDDYLSMGLPVNEQSLHYVQKTGYVHAVDIRTRGRSWWQNLLTQSMFRIAGLEVIRHTGTADHLHVFLPPNECIGYR